MELPNRKQRRLWAKEMGLLKKKNELPVKERLEVNKRAREAGHQIHLRNVERNLEREFKLQEERDLKKRESEIENLLQQGHTLEDALVILTKNETNDGTLDS
jgi:hypothetical protein